MKGRSWWRSRRGRASLWCRGPQETEETAGSRDRRILLAEDNRDQRHDRPRGPLEEMGGTVKYRKTAALP